jgi:hypothetical protein
VEEAYINIQGGKEDGLDIDDKDDNKGDASYKELGGLRRRRVGATIILTYNVQVLARGPPQCKVIGQKQPEEML